MYSTRGGHLTNIAGLVHSEGVELAGAVRPTREAKLWANVAYVNARSTGRVQSLSTLFRLGNVNVERASSLPKSELWELMREAAASAEYQLPRIEGS